MVATVTRLKMSATTVEYFRVDGYYAKNDIEHRRASGWHGRGAVALGLHGPVKEKRFGEVLRGYVPDTGIRLGRLREGAHQHRPGVDVTFSAPKSVSLEALVYAKPRTGARVIRAHDESVRATLDFIERELLQTRDYDRATGRRPRVMADGLVAATFRHRASRNLDPQLHTHCVIANMTRGRSGGWRSAEFTLLERSKKLLGAYYRNELQRRLMEMGYATAPTMVGRVPGFEIAGYDRGLIERFSTRRTETLAWMAERGWDYTPARMQQAVLYTRRRKSEPDRRGLEASWRLRAREVGRVRDWETTRGRGREPPRREAPSALAVVRRAVEHLEERRTVFAAHELRAWALAQASGRLSLGDLDAALGRLRRDGHLIEATARSADLAFVTDRALAAERDIIGWMREGIGTGSPLASAGTVEAGLEGSGLTRGQRAAVRSILLSGDRLVAVQGHAGTGKTSVMRRVKELAGEERMLGLAPSTRAARALGREAGIRARTLQGFLMRYRDVGDGVAGAHRMAEARKALGGAILVVDESSMIGTTQMRALMRVAQRAGVARLVLVGDRRQLRSVEAGQPFALLQEAGMATVIMDEVLRQRDPVLKSAVHHMIAQRPAMAVAGLGNGVLEMDADELGATAARLWLGLGAKGRAATEILAPTHALRGEINAAVREGLAGEGVLHGRVLEIERYVNLHLTRAQKSDAGNYREGDIALFHHDVYGVTVKAGDACRVAGIEDELVVLEHPDGKTRRIRPSGYIRYRLELYETEPIRLQAGDRVRWTRNDRQRGLNNGERAEVLRIGTRKVWLRTPDGRRLSLRRDDPQLHHLDHAYSSTVHAAQGMSCDNVIAVLDADHGPLTDQATFYVELTRARDNVVVLTSDKGELVEALETRTGEEMSALAAIGEQFAAPGASVAPAIIDKPALRPELAAWRAFAAQARSRGLEPFDARGCEEALSALLALAGRASRDDGTRDEIASIAAAYEAYVAQRDEAFGREHVQSTLAAIDACARERGGLLAEAADGGHAVHALASWDRWRERTRGALAAWRDTLRDDARYADPGRVPRDERRWAAETAQGLEAALVLDDTAQGLLRDWNDHGARAEAAGRHAIHHEGYRELLGRIEALAGAAKRPGEMPAALSSVLADHRALGEAHAFVVSRFAIVQTCADERRRLLEKAGGSAKPLRSRLRLRRAYARWRETAARAQAAGRELLGADKHCGIHIDNIDGARALIARTLEEAQRSGTLDNLPGWLLLKRHDALADADNDGLHPHFADAYRRLIEEMRFLGTRPGVSDEARLSMKREVAAYDQREKTRRDIRRSRDELDGCIGERTRHATEAAEGGAPLTDHIDYRSWRRRAEAARAKCVKIVTDTQTYGLFLAHSPDTADRLRRSLNEIDGYLKTDDRERARREEEQPRTRQHQHRRSRGWGLSM